MSDKALYDLLAKAQLHPNSLTHLERAIRWLYGVSIEDKNPPMRQLCFDAAVELEQLQQSHESETITEWLE